MRVRVKLRLSHVERCTQLVKGMCRWAWGVCQRDAMLCHVVKIGGCMCGAVCASGQLYDIGDGC